MLKKTLVSVSDLSLKLIDRFLEFSLSSCLCPSLPCAPGVPLTGILLQFFSLFSSTDSDVLPWLFHL